MMNFSRPVGAGLLSLVCFALSSCASVFPKPKTADIVYRLTEMSQAVDAYERRTGKDAIIIRIDTPIAPRALRTMDILVAPDASQLSSLSGGRWSETIPVLVQRALVNRLTKSPELIGVLPQSGARADYRVTIDIRSFEARFDQGQSNAPLAIADYHATLSNASTRKLVAVQTVRKSHRADAARVSAIAAAQDRANEAALDAITKWMEDVF